MSLLATRMQNLRAESDLDHWLTRASTYGAWELFRQDTDAPNSIITPELEQIAFRSIGSTLETPILEYNGNVTITNTRTATIADAENDSDMVTITFTTYSFGFTQVVSMFHNNEIGAQRDFNNKFLSGLYQLAAILDIAGYTALNTAKTQVFGETFPGVYSEVDNFITANLADEERIVGDINPLMFANDYFGPYRVLSNAGGMSLFRRMDEKGLYNEVNKKIQYADKQLFFSNRVPNAANIGATFFAVNQGSVGILTRVERDALYMLRSRTGHEWGIETMPLLNIPVGTYYYESVGDYNAIAGAATADMTRALKRHFGWSVDVAMVVSHNPDAATLKAPIMGLQIATT